MNPTKDSIRLPRNPALKTIFSHSRMIADALRRYAVHPRGPLDPRTVAALDFDTLEKLPNEWITDDFRVRIGDQAWRVRFRWARDWSDPRGYLLIPVEFQSQPRPDMALRMASYALRLYDELEATGVLSRRTPRPALFPLLIYNGPGRWTAATSLNRLVATPALEPAAGVRAEDIEDARRAARDLAAFQLRHTHFALDFDPYRRDDPVADNAMSLQIALESASTLDGLRQPLQMLQGLADRRLAEKMLDWTLLRLHVDEETAEEMKTMASLDDFHSQLDETVKGWTEQLLAEGVEQGIEQGIERGIEQGIERGRAEGERTVLRRQLARRFGPAAEPLYPLIDQVQSASKLAEIGEWLLADTIEQLIAKVEDALAGDRSH